VRADNDVRLSIGRGDMIRGAEEVLAEERPVRYEEEWVLADESHVIICTVKGVGS